MGKKLIEAADFPVIVELKLSNTGEWKKYACMTNAGITLNKENQESLDLNCGSSSYSDRVAEMKLNMFRVLNPNLLHVLQGAETTIIPEGAYTINEKKEILSDKVIVLPYKSNDGAGVTSLVVKSEDGATTYVADTDYAVEVKDNITKITIIGTSIKIGDNVIIEGSVNLNETKKIVTRLGTFADEKVDVRFVGMKAIEGKEYNFSLEATQGANTSAYNIEFLNKIKGGLPKGTEVTFKFDSNEVVIMDEISAKENTL